MPAKQQPEDALSFFKEHPLIILSLSILLCSGVGYWREYILMQEFGINIVVFAEADDFLLAAFKSPLIFLVSFPLFIGIIGLSWFKIQRLSHANAYLKRNAISLRANMASSFSSEAIEEEIQKQRDAYTFEKGIYKHQKLTAFYLAIAPIISGIMLYIFIDIEKNNTIKGIKYTPSYFTVVDLRTSRSLLPDNNKELVLITATEKYIFLYRHMPEDKGETYIVPSASITSIIQIPINQSYIRLPQSSEDATESPEIETNLSKIHQPLEMLNDDLNSHTSLNVTHLTSAKLHFREGPGRKYHASSILPEGTEVKVIGSSGIWSHIVESDHKEKGWVHTRYLEQFTSKTMSYSKENIALTPANLQLRTKVTSAIESRSNSQTNQAHNSW